MFPLWLYDGKKLYSSITFSSFPENEDFIKEKVGTSLDRQRSAQENWARVNSRGFRTALKQHARSSWKS